MGGRLQVFMLVVLVGFLCDRATAVRPLKSFQDGLTDFAARCRDVGGEQAAADVINLQHSLMTCIDFEGLYAEGYQYLTNNNVKGLLEKNCRNKEMFLNCANEGLQKLSRCLLEEEKPLVDRIQQVVEALLNFICKNFDDFVNIIGDQKEIDCMNQIQNQMLQNADRCSSDQNQLNIDPWKLLASKEKTCQMLDRSLQCVNDLTQEECKDSSFLTLVNSLIKEVQGTISCPSRLGNSGVDRLVAVIDTLPVVMGSLAWGLAAPLVLHLQ